MEVRLPPRPAGSCLERRSFLVDEALYVGFWYEMEWNIPLFSLEIKFIYSVLCFL